MAEKATTIHEYEQKLVFLKNQLKKEAQKTLDISRNVKLLENDNSLKELNREEERKNMLAEKEILLGAIETKISEVKELRELLKSSNDQMNNLQQELENLEIDRNEKIGSLKKRNDMSISEIEKLKSVIDEYSTRNNDLNEIVDKQRNKETVLIKDMENKQNELDNTRKNNQVLERNYQVNLSPHHKFLQIKFQQKIHLR